VVKVLGFWRGVGSNITRALATAVQSVRSLEALGACVRVHRPAGMDRRPCAAQQVIGYPATWPGRGLENTEPAVRACPACASPSATGAARWPCCCRACSRP
jgi:hypothetical protein